MNWRPVIAGIASAAFVDLTTYRAAVKEWEKLPKSEEPQPKPKFDWEIALPVWLLGAVVGTVVEVA